MAKSHEDDLLVETELCFKDNTGVFVTSVTLLWEDITRVENFIQTGDWKHLSDKFKTCIWLRDGSTMIILESYQKFRNQWIAVRAKMRAQRFWSGSVN